MKSVAGTLEQLVRFLTEERRNEDDAIQQVLLPNHPAFYEFQEMTETPYRVFFTDEGELNRWLRSCGWVPVNKSVYDKGSYREWVEKDSQRYLRLTEPIFDGENKLKVYTEDNWQDSWLQVLQYDQR